MSQLNGSVICLDQTPPSTQNNNAQTTRRSPRNHQSSVRRTPTNSPLPISRATTNANDVIALDNITNSSPTTNVSPNTMNRRRSRLRSVVESSSSSSTPPNRRRRQNISTIESDSDCQVMGVIPGQPSDDIEFVSETPATRQTAQSSGSDNSQEIQFVAVIQEASNRNIMDRHDAPPGDMLGEEFEPEDSDEEMGVPEYRTGIENIFINMMNATRNRLTIGAQVDRHIVRSLPGGTLGASNNTLNSVMQHHSAAMQERYQRMREERDEEDRRARMPPAITGDSNLSAQDRLKQIQEQQRKNAERLLAKQNPSSSTASTSKSKNNNEASTSKKKTPEETPEEDTANSCPICMENYSKIKARTNDQRNKIICLTKCGHVLCDSCLQQSAGVSYGAKKCPICRKTYAKTQVKRIFL